MSTKILELREEEESCDENDLTEEEDLKKTIEKI